MALEGRHQFKSRLKQLFSVLTTTSVKLLVKHQTSVYGLQQVINNHT